MDGRSFNALRASQAWGGLWIILTVPASSHAKRKRTEATTTSAKSHPFLALLLLLVVSSDSFSSCDDEVVDDDEDGLWSSISLWTLPRPSPPGRSQLLAPCKWGIPVPCGFRV